MNRPFFSIVLPTKNRPALLRDAITSVLLQNFDDYELIVSDNFNDEKTKAVIDEFKGNPHLSYLRTESELNIPDHWEFATKNTRGVYILILTDRAFLVQGALRNIHATISESPGDAPVVFWNYGYFDEITGVLRGEKKETGMKILNSTYLLKNFSLTLDAHYLPRPHVGCYKHSLIQKIREDLGRLYMPFGPDYTSSMLALAYSASVMYLPRPLVFFQGASVSSGTKAQISIATYLSSINVPNLYEFIPIKAPINTSLIFNDFLKIKNLAGGNFKDIDIDWVFYFVVCYQAIIESRIIFGTDQSDQTKLLEAWEKALSSFDKQTQTAVRKALRWRSLNIVKSYVKTTFIGRFLWGVKRALLHKPTHVYSSALHAGGFKN